MKKKRRHVADQGLLSIIANADLPGFELGEL